MKRNMGNTDGILRIVVAIIIGILFLTKTITGTLAIVLGVVALILLLTGLLGWCGLYTLLGINTCKLKNKGEKKE